ncbi:MAG: inositol monophosphatase [Candidatus Levybacteria bacterium]|nr:inositol monophosphatase [Candidatus Levybacteria bacterium]
MANALNVACEAVKKGAERALKYFSHNPEVFLKSDNTPFTVADKETETTIKETILQTFPDAHFVGEEFGGSFDSEDVWIIDPIDGTKNFIRSLPFWSILVAHYKNGEITEGVSYTPLMKELLYAEKGEGAYINEKKVSVSKTSNVTQAYISYPAVPSHFPYPENVSRILVAAQCARGFGDAFAYHLVANGRIDINMEPDIKVWDIAPFRVIIDEAGGKITNLQGKPWTVKDTTVVATNGLLHEEVIEILNLKQ